MQTWWTSTGSFVTNCRFSPIIDYNHCDSRSCTIYPHTSNCHKFDSQIFVSCSTSNPKCHVTFSKTKMNVNWCRHFLLKCHLNIPQNMIFHLKYSTNKISSFLFLMCQLMFGFFFTSHITCPLTYILFFFCATFCISNVKDCKNLWKTHMTLAMSREIFGYKLVEILS